MNRLLQISMKRLGRLQPALERIRDRAAKRQEVWLKRRGRDMVSAKKLIFRFRDKTLDRIGDWVEIQGLTKSSNFEVRACEEGWGVFEQGGNSIPVEAFAKKAEAIESGKRRARQRGGRVEVHTKHGTVQNSFTYQPT
ncbi:MAG: DUF2188 domain-containing protein [Bdellovibrionaceae bacterium]|nr:DUF2188 domain-containing protein [Pseudobdellovibrionaceae bacterium]